jgi:hypothetical protein
MQNLVLKILRKLTPMEWYVTEICLTCSAMIPIKFPVDFNTSSKNMSIGIFSEYARPH